LNKATFVDIILPLALPQYYTYAVPFDQVDELAIGKRVIVQFGKQKMYAAIIQKIHREKPAEFLPKLIESIIDEEPILSIREIKLWEWIASYYMCTVGEVMNAALPASLKLSSDSTLVWHPEFEGSFHHLKDKEYILAEALSLQKKISWSEIQKILDKKYVYPEVRSLIKQGIALILEELNEKYKPKVESFVTLHEFYQDKENLKVLFNELSKAKKQIDVLMHYISLAHGKHKLQKSILVKASSDNSSVNRLIDKDILIETKEEVSRLTKADIESLKNDALNAEQAEALIQIQAHFKNDRVTLLQGVTGSGKTHIYFKLMDEALAKNKQVLLLIPEISLTVQLIQRLQKVFGHKVGVYHSKYNSSERVEIWNKVLHREYEIVVGARSALFLPFQELGLVIVDEEHDSSYKQSDPSPRYQARDCSIVLASLHKANVLLASATPSLDSARNAELDKFAKVMLHERFGQTPLPLVHLIDMKIIHETKQFDSHYSFELLNQIKAVVAQKEQVILFQNRRGFSQYLLCTTCGWIPKCHQCDVSLTYHKYADYLACHYCGFKTKNKTKCVACGSQTLSIKGFGTEKVEDELNALFPGVRIDRLDLDAIKGKHGHEKIIDKFENHEVDILVGTQMVTKGLDFSNVTMVGVLNADQLLCYPDYRATERAFQLMVQVSGRAGRKAKRGNVFIQTSQVSNAIFDFVKTHDYASFYAHEIFNRKQFYYPPFCRLIHIQVKHKEVDIVNRAAADLTQLIKLTTKHNMVLGPTQPSVSKIKNLYIRDILCKIEKGNIDLAGIKLKLKEAIETLHLIKEYKSVFIKIDVDPQ